MKQNCLIVLSADRVLSDKLANNNSKKINLRMTHSMSKYICHFIAKDNPSATYESIQTYLPRNNEQCVPIFKEISDLYSTNLKDYVQKIITIQSKLIGINSARKNYELKEPAYMMRLLDNLSDDQKNQIRWLVDQWRDPENTTDLDCL